jgi:hypothetical protein
VSDSQLHRHHHYLPKITYLHLYPIIPLLLGVLHHLHLRLPQLQERLLPQEHLLHLHLLLHPLEDFLQQLHHQVVMGALT